MTTTAVVVPGYSIFDPDTRETVEVRLESDGINITDDSNTVVIPFSVVNAVVESITSVNREFVANEATIRDAWG